jgi:hypothetical protein
MEAPQTRTNCGSQKTALPVIRTHEPVGQRSETVSGINGDKARFHRKRKKKIAKRQRTRNLLGLAKGFESSTPRTKPNPREVKG